MNLVVFCLIRLSISEFISSNLENIKSIYTVSLRICQRSKECYKYQFDSFRLISPKLVLFFTSPIVKECNKLISFNARWIVLSLQETHKKADNQNYDHQQIEIDK